MNKFRKSLLSLFFFLLTAALLYGLKHTAFPSPPVVAPQIQSTPVASSSGVLGVQTKTDGCIAQDPYPDPACTPGAIFANATKDDICVSGYSQTVRNVPEGEKQQIYAEYGIVSHGRGEYEVDHFISLELGGSNDSSNLWPEPAQPTPGFHEKDLVENYLHDEVCNGKISLPEAQKEIRTDWLAVYHQFSK